MARISQPVFSLLEKRPSIILFGILLIALFIRVLALINWNDSLYADFLIWDERVYHNWALEIARGNGGSFHIHDFAPMPAYLMGFLYRIFSESTLSVRILNIALSIGACYLIYLIGTTLAGRPAGLISALAAALYGPFIFFSITILKTSLSVFLFALAMWLFLLSLKRESPFFAILPACAIGLLINVRPESMILVPVSLFIFALQHVKKPGALFQRAAGFVLGLLIALAPFSIAAYKASGEFSGSARGGFNLYLANNPANPYPYYRPVPFASSSPALQAVHFIIEASVRKGKRLTPGEASAYWTRQVLNSARENPMAFSKKLGLKCMAFFNRFEAADNYHPGFMSAFVPYFKLPFFAFWLVFPMGIAGLLLAGLRSTFARALLTVLAAYFIILTVFFTNVRIRLPLMTIAIPGAVWGILILIEKITQRDRRWIGAYVLLAGAIFTVELLPVPGAGDMSGYYNTHAIMLASKGKEQEALHYWLESSDMRRPYSAYADLSLASHYFKGKDIERARTALDRIDDGSFAAAAKYEMLGDILVSERDLIGAVDAYERSLSINSGLLSPRMKLIKLFQSIDPQRAFTERTKLDYVASFYPQK